MNKALFRAADFKSLIGAVTKLPSIGAFAGSEMITLEVKNGSCTASSFGVVLSVAQVPARGQLEPCAIDERLVQAFANLGEQGQVLAELTPGELQLQRSGHREITAPRVSGTKRRIHLPAAGQKLLLKADTAQKLKYQAEIAFSDSSRPELNAVYLRAAGDSIAVNQKCVSVMRCRDLQPDAPDVAVSIPLARLSQAGYQLHASTTEMVLQDTHCGYAMPAPVKAQTEFPLSAVHQFAAAAKQPLCQIPGQKLVQIVDECNSVLGGLAGTEVVLNFTIGASGIELHSQNGGAKFHRTLKCPTKAQAEVQIPLMEISRAKDFLTAASEVQIARGPSNECYLLLPEGWIMFPSWHHGKKKA